MPEFHADEPAQQEWKRKVLAREIELEEIDTAPFRDRYGPNSVQVPAPGGGIRRRRCSNALTMSRSSPIDRKRRRRLSRCLGSRENARQERALRSRRADRLVYLDLGGLPSS